MREKAFELWYSIEGFVSSNIKVVEGFVRKYKVMSESLERVQTEKGEIVVAKFILFGVYFEAVLVNLVEGILKKFLVQKMMRWGLGEAEFVWLVHGLIMLYGKCVIPG